MISFHARVTATNSQAASLTKDLRPFGRRAYAEIRPDEAGPRDGDDQLSTRVTRPRAITSQASQIDARLMTADETGGGDGSLRALDHGHGSDDGASSVAVNLFPPPRPWRRRSTIDHPPPQ